MKVVIGFVLAFVCCFVSGADISDIVKLKKSGIGDDVIIAFVNKADGKYDMTADTIKILKEVGLSDDVILAMIKHNQSPASPAQIAAPAPPAPAPAIEQPVEDAPKEVTISTFYERLTPYGTWVQDPEYGWVWQPGVAVTEVGWRPYCHGGHWIWTDYGWYWESDYQWGWATFHYGRWMHHPVHLWVWVPDCTWGPAWVHWRSGDIHVGWAALPPGAVFEAGIGFSFHSKHVGFDFHFGLLEDDFVFVPHGHFLEHDLHHHHICDHHEVVKIYNTTVIVKNEEKHHTLMNQGVGRKEVEKHCNTKIDEVKIKDNPKIGERHENGKIYAYRPEVKNTAPQTPTEVKNHQPVQRPSPKPEARKEPLNERQPVPEVRRDRQPVPEVRKPAPEVHKPAPEVHKATPTPDPGPAGRTWKKHSWEEED